MFNYLLKDGALLLQAGNELEQIVPPSLKAFFPILCLAFGGKRDLVL